MMTSTRLVRGTKGRLFAYLGVLILFAGVIFLYHNARVELDEVRNSLSKSRQEQDSLAAQIQVISDYKKDLEKSLNLEKAEHRQTKDELQSRMVDEHELRNKEHLENLNKYKALQQQYKLLQSEHEDLSELCNKAKVEQASCNKAVSHLDTQLSSLRQDLIRSEAEANNFKARYLRLGEENKELLEKLNGLQNHVELAQGEREKGPSSLTRRSSTKQAGGESAPGDGTGNHEQHLNVLPVALRSSTVAQEEILQPARPAQPGLLQSALSKTLENQSTTPRINADALQNQHKALQQAMPALPFPLMLSPLQQHDLVEKQEFSNNGPQGVLPAPLGFSSDNQYAQNAAPLQAPYKLHSLGHQDIPQNQGQMPPLAPLAGSPIRHNVLPIPPEHARNFAHHLPNFNQVVHANMNPFKNDFNAGNHDVGPQETQVNHPDQSLHKFVHPDNMFHLDGLKAHEALGHFYNMHNKNLVMPAGNKAHHGAQDLIKPVYQLERAANALPFYKSPNKNFNMAPLDGDVNQHSNLELPGGNPFVGLQHHDLAIAHGKIRAQPAHLHDTHQGGHYNNYQGGDYDKEDPPANNEGEDEDLDQIDYNNEPNQANPVNQVLPGHHAQKMVHRKMIDHHQEAVRPR